MCRMRREKGGGGRKFVGSVDDEFSDGKAPEQRNRSLKFQDFHEN